MGATENITLQDCEGFLEQWLRNQQGELCSMNYSPPQVRWSRPSSYLFRFVGAMGSLTLFPKTNYRNWLRPVEHDTSEAMTRDWYALGQDAQKAILDCGAEELSVQPSYQPDRTTRLPAAR